jgi:hypothetical protein
LAQDRDAVGVDILSLEQVVLKWDHIATTRAIAASAARRGRRPALLVALDPQPLN